MLIVEQNKRRNSVNASLLIHVVVDMLQVNNAIVIVRVENEFGRNYSTFETCTKCFLIIINTITDITPIHINMFQRFYQNIVHESPLFEDC